MVLAGEHQVKLIKHKPVMNIVTELKFVVCVFFPIFYDVHA